jgi:hypothetical protein
MKLLVNLTNVHRDEQAILKKYLEDNCWQVDELPQDEINAVTTLINHDMDQYPVDRFSGLSTDGLRDIKDKLNK